MFGVDFSEMIVIAIVALVVIGPERLPKVARAAGLLFGRAQRYVNGVKSDLRREMQLDELRQLKSEMQASARELKDGIAQELQSVRESAEQSARGESLSDRGTAAPSAAQTSVPASPADSARPPAAE